jgi:metal-responsive CopG/Arc/MetJ family transcriptional regulator
MPKNDKLKPVSVRIPTDMFTRIQNISNHQTVPNIAATIRDLLQEALNTRESCRGE